MPFLTFNKGVLPDCVNAYLKTITARSASEPCPHANLSLLKKLEAVRQTPPPAFVPAIVGSNAHRASGTVKKFHYSDLQQVNSIRKTLFDRTLDNIQLIIERVTAIISQADRRWVINDVYALLGASIDKDEAETLRKHILGLSQTLTRFLQNKNKFIFYAEPKPAEQAMANSAPTGIVATYHSRRDVIEIHDLFFVNSPITPLFTLLHEFSHSTKTADHFYFSHAINVQHDNKIMGLNRLKMAAVIDVCIRAFSQQIREKLQSLVCSTPHVNSLIAGKDTPKVNNTMTTIGETEASNVPNNSQFSKLIVSNADTVALYTLHLFNSDADDACALKETTELFNREENAKPF